MEKKAGAPNVKQEAKDFFTKEEQERLRRNAKTYKKTVEKEHGKNRGKEPADHEENRIVHSKLVKESYKISMKRIRYELSLDYENEVERMLAMLDINSIKEVLQPEGKSPEK